MTTVKSPYKEMGTDLKDVVGKVKYTRPSKGRKTSRKGWIRKLDNLVREIVLARNPQCVLADGRCSQVMQAGHLFSRVNYSTRWDLDNVWTQCSSHNLLHEHNPWPFFNWFIDQFSKEKLEALALKHNQVTHFKDFQLEELYNLLKEQYGV